MSALAAYRTLIRPPSDHGKIAVLSTLITDGREGEGMPIFFKQQIDGVRRRAASLGYHVELFALRPDARQHEQLSRVLIARGIQGVIVGGLPEGFGALEMRWDRLASSSIGRSLLQPRLHNASYNYAEDMMTAYRMLRARGYARIGFCNHLIAEQRAQYDYAASYLKSTCQDGAAHGACPLFLMEDRKGAGIVEWVRRHRIDAVISHGSMIEMIYSRLREVGISVPEEVGLVTFALNETNHTCAGLVEDMEALGEAAVMPLHMMLLNGDRGIPSPRHQILLNAIWREGATVRPPVEQATSGRTG
jgi:LacI family transcriptional regulator